MLKPLIVAPKREALPPAQVCARIGGPTLADLRVGLRVVTPVLGGAARVRENDRVDVIRAPTVRGHLRFWWRALYGSRYSGAGDAKALYEAESALWGRAAEKGAEAGRSAVELWVEEHSAQWEHVTLEQQSVEAQYALWPAREPVAEIGAQGVEFVLRVRCPRGQETEVRNALRAWILFGGYGGRTRRGLGSLAVVKDADRWLPTAATREALRQCFGGEDLFAGGAHGRLFPSLRGAGLTVGPAEVNEGARRAWEVALGWLREFRQGESPATAQNRDFAREKGRTTERPGRSNWPESDKIRRISRLPHGADRWEHPARHNDNPVFPRAGFGLPIAGQFQLRQRKRDPKNHRERAADFERPEPGRYEIRWRADASAKPQDRLASPLVVKALALADGSFVPCALWLSRAWPHGEVVAGWPQGKNFKAVSKGAPFDGLVAEGDTALFAPLATTATRDRLKTAFFDWLTKKPGVKEIVR